MENKKIIELAPFDECTGCAVCAAECPKHAINMVYKNAFLYPEIDNNLCVKCGKCTRVCPILTGEAKYQILEDRKAYCGYSKDYMHLKKSSSGSFSYVFNRCAIEKGYVVYGVAFDGNGILKYKKAVNLDEIEAFIGSKYIQAESEFVYKSIQEDLKNNNYIILTGLPCVLSAVRKNISESDKAKILFVKIICHGISSAKIYNSIVKYIEDENKSKIVSYNFRSKAFGWKRQSVDIKFANGKVKNQLALDNLHHYWFAYHWNLRLSCFHCKHRTYDEADIIIGDFWGVIDKKIDIAFQNGLSIAIINTARGLEFFDLVKDKLVVKEVAVEDAIKRQPPLVKNPIVPVQREEFIKDFNSMNFSSFVEKYKRRPSLKEAVKKVIFNTRFRLVNIWK